MTLKKKKKKTVIDHTFYTPKLAVAYAHEILHPNKGGNCICTAPHWLANVNKIIKIKIKYDGQIHIVEQAMSSHTQSILFNILFSTKTLFYKKYYLH